MVYMKHPPIIKKFQFTINSFTTKDIFLSHCIYFLYNALCVMDNEIAVCDGN